MAYPVAIWAIIDAPLKVTTITVMDLLKGLSHMLVAKPDNGVTYVFGIFCHNPDCK